MLQIKSEQQELARNILILPETYVILPETFDNLTLQVLTVATEAPACMTHATCLQLFHWSKRD